jgi:hypothetical protein
MEPKPLTPTPVPDATAGNDPADPVPLPQLFTMRGGK